MDRCTDSFLQHVALSLKNKFGDNLSRVAVVFPNKRANLFLNEYLVAGNEVMWAPTYLTISELFASLTHLQIADPIDVVCRLYKLYAKATNSDESLDYFYGWGERLLADFDDLDKNLGDADKIFRDLHEYQEIGGYDEILDEEQIAQLRKFAGDFSVKDRSKVRERFMQLWQVMLPLYKGLKESLAKDGMAYEGQLYRDVLEHLKREELTLPAQFDCYAFVGFNVLDSVEREMFKLLQAKGKALFYWDYDVHYVRNSDPFAPTEAGVFLQENLKTFPNALGDDTDLYNNLTGKNGIKLDIAFAAADTDAIQAQYVSQWLSTRCKHFDSNEARQTAIVLCDEGQLLPVLHALPKSNGYDVNITKGFPLTHTPAYASVIRLMNRMLYDQNVRRSKQPDNFQPMSLQQSEAMDKLLEIQQSVKSEAVIVRKSYKAGDWKCILYTESYFQIYTIISRFVKLVETGILSIEGTKSMYISLDTLFKLLKQVMRSQTIPFHGEPAVGLQVMGVLETRCLDFKHVLMLSVGEGILPQKATDASFIPFLIRKRYGLTTYLRKTAVYAYYFYRLMQRAQDVTLVYNNSTSGTHRGEMSRFMRGMLYDTQLGQGIKRYHLKSVPHPLSMPKADLVKCVDAGNSKQPFCDKISPSALNTYLSCKRKFYYHYIKLLRKPDDTDGIIDPRDLGTIFHYAAQLFYENVVGNQRIETNSLRSYLNAEGAVQLQAIVRKAFRDKGIERTTVVETIVDKFLHDTIKYDSGELNSDKALALKSLEFVAAEHKAEVCLKVPFGKGGDSVDFKLYGEIDRLDLAEIDGVGQCMRVVDYKTGGSSVQVKDMEHLFSHQQKEDPKYPFQTFAYCLMVHENSEFSKYKGLPLIPALYYVHHFRQKGFNPYISFEGKSCTDFRAYADEFKSNLIDLLSEIIDPENTFECTTYKDTCKYCDFCDMCGRNS